MRASRTLLIGIVVTITIVVAIPVVIYAFDIIKGRYIGMSGRFSVDVADYITGHGLDASECLKMVYSPFEFIRYPTIEDQKWACISGVAKRKHDPTACGLLPAVDVEVCIAATFTRPRSCGVNRDRSVVWKSNDEPDGVGGASFEECQGGSYHLSREGRACCQIARVRFLEAVTDCGLAGVDPQMLDHCYYEVALKSGDLSECYRIDDPTERAGCEVDVRARGSSIRSAFD